MISPAIFRAYDIRGHADTELNRTTVDGLGRAIGTLALRGGQTTLVVGRDGRLSSPRIYQQLIDALQATGCDVIGIGLVATPMLYFATHYCGTQAGVMVTGSHNPSDMNGMKVVLDGKALNEPSIQALRVMIDEDHLAIGAGQLKTCDISEDYITAVQASVPSLPPLKVVLDCCHGAAGFIAARLYRSMGCEVVALYDSVDGNFPAHSPDPFKPGSLDSLKHTVKAVNADLGLAFDGDADRLVAIDELGRSLDPDQLMMLFVEAVTQAWPDATIVYDIKSSQRLAAWIERCGARAVISKSGHSLIKQQMRREQAALGGEYTGHYFFTQGWFGFDDGLYAGLRLLSLLSDTRSLATLQSELPAIGISSERHIAVSDRDKFAIVERFIRALEANPLATDQRLKLDGIRLTTPTGWGLLRASNTSATLNLRFEADNEAALSSIEQRFMPILQTILNSLVEQR